MIKLVSIAKIEKDFHEYNSAELSELSASEFDDYINVLTLKMFEGFKHGVISELDSLDKYAKVMSNALDIVKSKFSNADYIALHRKFSYVYHAYCLSSYISYINLNLLNTSYLLELIALLENSISELNLLLTLYYYNYSNSGYLMDLFHSLSMVDNIDLTFEIHDKYVYEDDKFSTNKHLMNDLDYIISKKVKLILEFIDLIEKTFDLTYNENDFDKTVSINKEHLKELFSIANDFDKKVLLQIGQDKAVFKEIEDSKKYLDAVNRYKKHKSKFMELYNENAFLQISKSHFEDKKKDNPDADFSEFMKKEPKYNLKECKLIKPLVMGIN